MTGLAGWLLVVALLDLFRARRDSSSPRARAVLGGLAVAATTGLAVSAHPHGAAGWGAWLAGAVLAGGWIVASGLALAAGRGFAWAYGAFALAVVALGLAGPRTGRLAWLSDVLSRSVLAGADPGRVLLATAVLAAQLSTANILIRMLLDLVGVPAQDNEKNLRGGRVLGPMERLVIVGLGLSGNLTGASIVVAAKALLRFPELRPGPAARTGGASDVTEYFLIGSFASWLVAFAAVALAAL